MKKGPVAIVAAAVVVLGGAVAALLLVGSESAGTDAVEEVQPGIVPLDPFLINVGDPGAERFAKLSLSLAVTPAGAAGGISADPVLQARMRDRVLTLLTSKSVAELMSPLGRETLRRELELQIDPLLSEAEIQAVRFSELVVQ